VSRALHHTAAALAALLLGSTLSAQGEGMSGPNRLAMRQEDSSMQDRIGASVPRELSFTDERDRPLLLKQFFPGDRPVILDLGYFGCPGMCGQVMEGMVDALNQVDLEPGKDYEILTISIDPRETPAVAKQRKDAFLFKLQKIGGQQGWHFATGSEAAIQALTEAVGFRYFWAEHDNRFDHPPALIFLSPQGKVTRVLQGTTFVPRDVRLALVEASEGKAGTFMDQLQLSCLTFDPVSRTWSLKAMTVMKIGGAVTVAGLLIMVFVMMRRERRRLPATGPTPS
jgi:protein SCO1/2